MDSILVILVIFSLSLIECQLSFHPSDEISTDSSKKTETADTRLGLLASTLGVEPVPGASELQKGLLGQYNNKYSGGTGGGGLYGGDGGKYNPAPHGGKCECVPKQYCGGRPGSYPPPGSGEYGKGNGEFVEPGPPPTNPELDGAGNIDIRIVNRPPAGIVCGEDQIYCCGDPGRDGPGQNNGPSCGIQSIINVPNRKQVYGEAEFGEYPWFSVILSSSNNYLGAGALLDTSHVLTAAHKVKDFRPNYPMKVRFGEWNAQDDSEPYKNIEIEISRVDIHPSFNAENLQNDVAIIKLAQPIDTSAYPHIKTVCLPKGHTNFVGRRCWVAGFGKDAFKVGKHSYYLREVDVPILDSNLCESRLRQTHLGNLFELNRKSFLCAGGEDGKDACTGDGGSPLVCKGEYGEFQVVGLVSWGIGCASYGIPGVYVNVPSYSNWIHEKLAY